jgi:bacillithiol biosynthesis deacetylase BshB1
MELDILTIGAHPDDIELGCSGTVAKAAASGYKVGLLDLTEGELGTRGSKIIRAREARRAALILGARLRENLRLPDGGIQITRKTILKLIQVYRRYRPKILIIPYAHERHPDHEHAHRLCREAWFYSGLRKIGTRFCGKAQEPWRPHAVFQFMQWYEFAPSFVVDISDVYKKREKAILAFSSQFYNPASKEPQTMLSRKSFLEFVEARAKLFGGKIGVRYGEPFYSNDLIGVSDLFDLRMVKG